MAELSSHSYHYKDSIFNKREEDVNEEDDDEEKKKPRRRKRMLTGVSKQRRAANERERKRLQIINMAYKELKKALPLLPNEDNIPKIEIVRLATRTIRYLSDILNNIDSLDNSTNNINNDNNNNNLMNSNNNNTLSDFEQMLGFRNEFPIATDPTQNGSMNNSLDISPSIKLETFEHDVDVTNLLFPTADDIKLEFDSNLQNSDEGSSVSSVSSDSFCGLDISSFLAGPTSPCPVSHKDVFPSMLYW